MQNDAIIFNVDCTLLFRKNLNKALISFGSHSSKGNNEHLRHLHGTPGLAGDRGLRFSGDGPRPGLSDSHSPDLDLDVNSPAVHSECPGDFKALRKLSENGDDSSSSGRRVVTSFLSSRFRSTKASATAAQRTSVDRRCRSSGTATGSSA